MKPMKLQMLHLYEFHMLWHSDYGFTKTKENQLHRAFQVFSGSWDLFHLTKTKRKWVHIMTLREYNKLCTVLM